MLRRAPRLRLEGAGRVPVAATPDAQARVSGGRQLLPSANWPLWCVLVLFGGGAGAVEGARGVADVHVEGDADAGVPGQA
jgi:hypothetical protein